MELVVTRRVTLFTQDGNGGCPGDTVLTLLDGQLDQVATDDDGGEAECSRITLDLEPGDYTIEVTTYQGTNVPDYTLTVKFD